MLCRYDVTEKYISNCPKIPQADGTCFKNITRFSGAGAAVPSIIFNSSAPVELNGSIVNRNNSEIIVQVTTTTGSFVRVVPAYSSIFISYDNVTQITVTSALAFRGTFKYQVCYCVEDLIL